MIIEKVVYMKMIKFKN